MRYVVAVTALVGLAAACSDDTDGSSPATATPTTLTTTTATPTTPTTTTATANGGPLGPILFADPHREGGSTLWTSDADGSNLRLVEELWDSLIVSPDGSSLLMGKPNDDGRFLPYFADLDNGTEGFLPWSDPTLNFAPGAYSPDGTHMVAEAWDNSDPSRNGVYTAAVHGGDLLRLTNPAPKHDFPNAYTNDVYSPAGDKILFFRTSIDGHDSDDDPMNLMVINTDGSGELQLNPPDTEVGMRSFARTATWSPDGTKVAFVAVKGIGASFEAEKAIFVIGADGAGLEQITDWTQPLSVGWSPDGALLAITLEREGELQIATMRPDGSNLTFLTSSPKGKEFSLEPRWSPDGVLLMYHHYSAKGWSVWTVDVATGDARKIIDESTNADSYVWTGR